LWISSSECTLFFACGELQVFHFGDSNSHYQLIYRQFSFFLYAQVVFFFSPFYFLNFLAFQHIKVIWCQGKYMWITRGTKLMELEAIITHAIYICSCSNILLFSNLFLFHLPCYLSFSLTTMFFATFPLVIFFKL